MVPLINCLEKQNYSIKVPHVATRNLKFSVFEFPFMATLAKLGDDLSSAQLLFLSRAAEATESYNDMTQFTSKLIKHRCKNSQEISLEERNLFSVAYKNVVGAKRSSWRKLQNLDTEEYDEELVEKYRIAIEDELRSKCMEVIKLLDLFLLVQNLDKKDECEVFYLKMCADYWRYLAEMVLNKEEKSEHEKEYAVSAENMYSKALQIAKLALSETHPTRLGLALNFSVNHVYLHMLCVYIFGCHL